MKPLQAWLAIEDFDDENESLGLSIREGAEVIATVPGIGCLDFDNAQLIAAAPELLAACKAVEAAQRSGTYQEAFDEVRAAIAKATSA